VEELEAPVAGLAATVKAQSAQIQKVSAQLEASRPVPQVAENRGCALTILWNRARARAFKRFRIRHQPAPM